MVGRCELAGMAAFSERLVHAGERRRKSLTLSRIRRRMFRRHWILWLAFFFIALSTRPAAAQTRFIVRDRSGRPALHHICARLGCSVQKQIDDAGVVFLVTTPTTSVNFLEAIKGMPGIANAELDVNLQVETFETQALPSGLNDTTMANYFGQSVWDGYANQPAVGAISLPLAQSSYGVTGTGIVAVIDTGVDPNHPVLQSVLLAGYDFTRNQSGGSELADVNQSTMAVVDGDDVAQVNQSTMAVVDSDDVDTLSESQLAAFGHGTMVAGIVHLVAPTASIMPLKAFQADGTAHMSDVLRAIYYATRNNAKVLNMSFDFTGSSRELHAAIDHATSKGVVCVAAVGNGGQPLVVYPAGFPNVMGVASTSDDQTLSSFSNYGQPPVWVAAPGEGIITTYPFGTYAAGWGTSFSAPFVSGTVALLRSVNSNLNQQSAAQAISNADYITPDLGHGLLDVNQAVGASNQTVQSAPHSDDDDDFDQWFPPRQ